MDLIAVVLLFLIACFFLFVWPIILVMIVIGLRNSEDIEDVSKEPSQNPSQDNTPNQDSI